ncbi:hypothetical protein [Neoaquamicrobium sediminum]|uniref:hypothetical protein n=1 Tax=Neoaquamicrobium sediminum TaxID=1849104 RepID=UPI003BA9C666
MSEAGQSGVPEIFVPFLFTFGKGYQIIEIKGFSEYVPFLFNPVALGSRLHCQRYFAAGAGLPAWSDSPDPACRDDARLLVSRLFDPTCLQS